MSPPSSLPSRPHRCLPPPSSLTSASAPSLSASSLHRRLPSSLLLSLLLFFLLLPSSHAVTSFRSSSPSDPQSDLIPNASSLTPHSRVSSHDVSTPASPSDSKQRKPASRHIHDPSEDIPIGVLPDAPRVTASVAPQSPPAAPFGRAELTAPVAPAKPSNSDSCLTADEVAAEKAAIKARLLSIMERYVALWTDEERAEEDMARLYDAKKVELKASLKAKKAALLARTCDSDDNFLAGRRLLSLDTGDDDWAELDSGAGEEESPDSLPVFDDDDRGIAARIVAGGNAGGNAEAPELGGRATEEEDAPLMDASIHPYAFPSAFTELSERDIESRHASTPTAAGERAEVDYENGGFVASISPARYSPAAAAPSRSQRDIDEDLEEEKRKRRERLRSMRSHPSVEATLSEAELEAGGHFVASISPMAPQRSSAVLDDDEAFIGSIGPPPVGGQSRRKVVEAWKAEDEKEEMERLKAEVKASSRARLEAIAMRAKSRTTPVD